MKQWPLVALAISRMSCKLSPVRLPFHITERVYNLGRTRGPRHSVFSSFDVHSPSRLN